MGKKWWLKQLGLWLLVGTIVSVVLVPFTSLAGLVALVVATAIVWRNWNHDHD